MLSLYKTYLIVKTHFLLSAAAALLLCVSLSAQNPGADVVKSVRAAYAAAKEKINLTTQEDGAPRNDMVATIRCMVPATGPRTEVFHCYFDLETDENGAHYLPYFITRKYNVAAREFYEEYLYDPVEGRLRFVLLQGDTFEGGKNTERYYYDDEGMLSGTGTNGKRTLDDEIILENAEHFRELIPKLLDFSY